MQKSCEISCIDGQHSRAPMRRRRRCWVRCCRCLADSGSDGPAAVDRVSEWWQFEKVGSATRQLSATVPAQSCGACRWCGVLGQNVRVRHVLTGRYLAIHPKYERYCVSAGGVEQGARRGCLGCYCTGGRSAGSTGRGLLPRGRRSILKGIGTVADIGMDALRHAKGLLTSKTAPLAEPAAAAGAAAAAAAGAAPVEGDDADVDESVQAALASLHAEVPLTLVEAGEQLQSTTIWRFVAADGVADKQSPVQLSRIVCLQSAKCGYFLRLNTRTRVYHENAIDAASIVKPAEGESRLMQLEPDSVLPSITDARADVVASRFANVDDIWGVRRVDRALVALLYRSAHVLNRLRSSFQSRTELDFHKSQRVVSFFLGEFRRLLLPFQPEKPQLPLQLTAIERWSQFAIAAQGGLDVLLRLLQTLVQRLVDRFGATGVIEDRRVGVDDHQRLMLTLAMLVGLVSYNEVTAQWLFHQRRLLRKLQLDILMRMSRSRAAQSPLREVVEGFVELHRAIFTASREVAEQFGAKSVRHMLSLCNPQLSQNFTPADKVKLWQAVLRLLTSLCAWDGVPLPGVQSAVGQELFAEPRPHLLWKYDRSPRDSPEVRVLAQSLRVEGLPETISIADIRRPLRRTQAATCAAHGLICISRC